MCHGIDGTGGGGMETRIHIWTPLSSRLRRMPRAVVGNGDGVVDDEVIRRRRHRWLGNGGQLVGRINGRLGATESPRLERVCFGW
jgi:hypothetical protein